MIFDVITIFPDFFSAFSSHGVVKRGIEAGLVHVNPVDLRGFTHDRHRTTDDRPFGGGEGMVMKPEPIFEALDHLEAAPPRPTVALLTPRGRVFDQAMARRLSLLPRLILVCGRYEGIDERVALERTDMEISIGDYVLSGGEVAALVIMDSVIRLLPGVLGCAESANRDSFSDGLLEFPQYTRPRTYRGLPVPEVLTGGDHGEIARWRRKRSLEITLQRRPDLLGKARLSQGDLDSLETPGRRP